MFNKIEAYLTAHQALRMLIKTSGKYIIDFSRTKGIRPQLEPMTNLMIPLIKKKNQNAKSIFSPCHGIGVRIPAPQPLFQIIKSL